MDGRGHTQILTWIDGPGLLTHDPAPHVSTLGGGAETFGAVTEQSETDFKCSMSRAETCGTGS